MGAAEARALWQRRRASRCFLVHEDATMPPPRLTCCHHQQQQQHSSSSSSSSSSSAKNSLSSASFGDSSDFSSDTTKWWLKGSSGFDEDIIANSFLQHTKFVDLTELTKEKKEEEDYSFISKKDTAATTPWWRSTTDQDELALLLSTRSLDHHIQNCDLPPPHKLHKSIHCTSAQKGFQTALKSPWKKQGAWTDRLFERSLSYNSSSNCKNSSPKSSPKSDDLSKAQLLEALRHSQTRAREAEKAAEEASAEKDRLITILMRQASQILAYKQWIKLLEMESLRLQMKREEEEEEPEQVEGMNLKKRKQRGKKIGRYMMAFALGFSLIGAGLLLGWTVGWLFPF